MKSTLSPHDGAKIIARDAETLPVSAPADGDETAIVNEIDPFAS